MRISVALCTYNGAAYLAEQLRSIAGQTRPPDEVVVCDDRSTDGTVAIVSGTPMPCPVSLSINEANLGSTRNFERAIGRCTGDVIVLSDQDDIWLPQKLTRIEAAFRDRPGLGLFASDAVLIDERGDDANERLWETIPFPLRAQRRLQNGGAVEQLTRCNVITGATAAFAARLREVVLPIPPYWVHDGWIALIAAAIAPVLLDQDPLIQYRRHAAQQIGARSLTIGRQIATARRLDRAYFERLAGCYATARDRLFAFRSHLGRPGDIDRVGGRAAFAEAQARMRTASRLTRWWLGLGQLITGRYFRYGLGLWGWKTLAADLFL